MRVSIVIPNRNGGELLGEVLRAIAGQTFSDHEVIVVDNASTDGSIDSTEALGVRALRLDRNTGFAAACNAGAEAASGELVAFLNNDAVPEPSWLEELVDCIERHPDAGCVDSKLFQLGSERVLDGAGDELTWTLKAFRRGFGQREDDLYTREEQILLASGTACLWRRDVFTKLGGFAEDFFAYYEDVDLSLRAQRAGHEIWFAPAAIVWHRREGRTADRRQLDAYLASRNRWATIIRNAPGWWLVRELPVIALGELMSAGRAIASGQVVPYGRAMWQLARWVPTLLRQRRTIASLGELSRARVEPFVRHRMPPLRTSLAR